jgi:hypothetical protein
MEFTLAGERSLVPVLPILPVNRRIDKSRMMYTYIMQRTQISLTAAGRQALNAEAARTGKSLSALIRDAVETVYGTWRSSADDLDLMRQSFGSWADRKEDGASMVERLRSGSRIAPSEH